MKILFNLPIPPNPFQSPNLSQFSQSFSISPQIFSISLNLSKNSPKSSPMSPQISFKFSPQISQSPNLPIFPNLQIFPFVFHLPIRPRGTKFLPNFKEGIHITNKSGPSGKNSLFLAG